MVQSSLFDNKMFQPIRPSSVVSTEQITNLYSVNNVVTVDTHVTHCSVLMVQRETLHVYIAANGPDGWALFSKLYWVGAIEG